LSKLFGAKKSSIGGGSVGHGSAQKETSAIRSNEKE